MNFLKGIRRYLPGMPNLNQESLSLNFMTLAFTGKLAIYERDFLDDYFVKTLNHFRFSMVLALVFYCSFAFLDARIFPAYKEQFWFIRFGIITPNLIIIYALSYTKSFKKYMQWAIAFVMFSTSFGIIIMIILGSPSGNYSYYAGIILIFIFGYTFTRARFIYASISGWSIVIAYEISIFVFSDTPFDVIISNNFFFISSNLIGMFISYFLELTSRSEFYVRVLLEKEKENVKLANNALEKRVMERTEQLYNANLDLKKEMEIRRKFERERADLEKQLFQLQKMETIGTLAGGIAHDFNNILTPILGYTDMALEELPEESNLRFDIEQINNAAVRGKDLVQQILTFSREVDVNKKPIRLQPIISEALNLLKASFPPGVIIKHNLDPMIGTVLADPTHIHQIMMNLCTNASHAMIKSGGVLEVRLDAVTIDQKRAEKIRNLKKGEYIRLIISDTGHGMDLKTKERIFEPFFTRKEVGSGSGLGLSVVHGIINNYGGAIEVDSAPGKGTTFTIYLPRHSSDGFDEDKLAKRPVKGDEHVLFVDDEPEITFMGKKMLENLGYKVTIKTDSLAALDDFKTDPDKYALLVTDQNMPELTGTDLAFRMKETRPELKVIIITGFADNLSGEVLARCGVSDVILKPMVLDDFSKTIRRVLDSNNHKTAL
ncbi:MAG TPA: ATP-binding protein [Bacteroidales bacterium]|nr:ATP-binding protein [Bacteroidales bacterium]